MIEGLRLHDWISEFLMGLPAMRGGPIVLEFQPELTVCRGKLFSGRPEKGRAVYGASFLPERHIVLEHRLLSHTGDLRLMLTHELFHFAWRRLGNRHRAEYESLLRAEQMKGARGELGESSSVAKEAFTGGDWTLQSKPWKNYVCESFCDTAAWLHAGVARNRHVVLSSKWNRARAKWFEKFGDFKV